MAKQGRPGIPYEKFVEIWVRLIDEGRAGTNVAHDILGGSKSTITAYRERYEREKTSQQISIIKNIELPKAICHTIAEMKVKELTALEKTNEQLIIRIDDYLSAMKEVEGKLLSVQVELDDAKTNFDAEKLKLERQLAAAEARIEDMQQREQKLMSHNEQLGNQYNDAKQAAAVAKKEIEMLREQAKKK